MNVRSYQDPTAPNIDVRIDDQFLSKSMYSEVVKKIIIPCTDVVFIMANDQAIYLAHRSVYPSAAPWVVGGRIFFNDVTPAYSMARCVRRETGMDIAPERFVFMYPVVYSWVQTQQGNHGGKNLALTFYCEITPEEKEHISASLITSEYLSDFGLQRFDRERLVKEKCHPALIDFFDTLYPTSKVRNIN